MKSKTSTTKVMSILAAVAASVFAVAIPSIYYSISVNGAQRALTTESAYLAKSIENIIQASPDLWEFENVRLKEILSQPLIYGSDDEREIRNVGGKLVINNDFTESRPVISASTKFFDSGRVAGSIVVRNSIRSQLINTALLGILSSLIGYLTYFVFRTYPLRRLESTLTDLRREREKSDKTLYAIGDGVITVDHLGKILFINRVAEALVGMDTAEAVGRQLEEVYVLRQSQENRPGAVGEKGALLIGKGGHEYAIEEVRTHFNETEDDEGGIVIVFRDISERKKAEDALQKSEEDYRTVANFTYDWEYWWAPDGSMRFVSPSCERHTGYRAEEFLQDPGLMLRITHPDYRDQIAGHLPVTIHDGPLKVQSHKMEYRIITRSGEERWIGHVCQPVYNDGGKYLGQRACNRDISERKQAETLLLLREQALARSEQFLNTIIDTEPDCIKMLDIDCNLLMMNRAGLEMVDADSLEQLKGQCLCPLITDPYRDDFIALTKQVFQGIPGILEFETIGLKGRHVWLETHAVPFRNECGDIVALLGITRDITERKQSEEEKLLLEQQLHQAQKMESLGVLAGGIAHDFNNILAVIMCYSSLGQQKPEKAAEFMQEIEKASERAAGLCRQMLAYAGKTQFVESHVDMTALVDDILNMLKSTLHQNAAIKPYLSGDIPQIQGDASQLRQIVMNLVINASEAVGEEQGEIRVALTKADITAGQQEKDHAGKVITPGTYLCLEVTDTGCGMDDETMNRVFEPFYTTKFVGRGLGMSAVLGIITSHMGALQFSSNLGQGTTFKVYLPVQTGETAVESPKQTTPAAWEGSGTILLVDDEEQILKVAKALLESLKFSVIEASNGIEAIEQYRRNAADITLVLTDIGMPLMGGYELISELKKLDPKLPIIISSGFGDTVVTSKIAPEEIAGMISKPYRFEQLREVLKSVVEDALAKQA